MKYLPTKMGHLCGHFCGKSSSTMVRTWVIFTTDDWEWFTDTTYEKADDWGFIVYRYHL